VWIYLLQLLFGSNTALATDSGKGFSQSVTASIKKSLMDIWSSFFVHIPYFVAGLVILMLTWAASKLVSRILSRVLKRTQVRSSLRELADRFIVISVWVVGILLAAMIVFPGLTPAKALGAMGIASIAVGFAFKDIFENFFAGVLLLWRFPFESGDFIECQGVTGKVERVLVRMTQIRLPSGELVVMPNSTLFKNPVEVLTNRNKRRTL
jgi:small conductance mechanosensitive channel